jgi:hypothetical protein
MAQVPQPVPAWAPPLIGDKEVMEQLKVEFNPVWLNWFLTGQAVDPALLDHNTLNGLQGGIAGQYYHLSQAVYNAVIAAFADQLANLVFAGPATGAAAAPGFRALVNADLPASGVSAATYGSATATPQITVNAKGVITAAADVTVTPAVSSITGLGTNVATFLATPSSANLRAALTDETGTGSAVFADSPTLITPVLGVASGTSLTTSGRVAVGGAINTSYQLRVYGTVAKGTTATEEVALIGSSDTSGPLALRVEIANNATAGSRFINLQSVEPGVAARTFKINGQVAIDASGNFTAPGTITLSALGGGGGLVSVGAADSGGAGFKLLRVPN